MALNDILPWKSPFGGTSVVESFRSDASPTYFVGDPVTLATTGELQKTADDDTAPGFLGIALAPASYKIGGVASTKNPRTGVNYTTGDMVPVALAVAGQQYISANFATGGAGAAVTPTLALALGQVAGISVSGSGTNGLSQTLGSTSAVIDVGTTNNFFRIVDVLDVDKNSIQDPKYSSNTGVYVVVTTVSSALTSTSDPVAD